MRNKNKLSLLIFSIFTLIFSFNSFADNPPSKPNIIFVFLDDLGYGDVGFNPGTVGDVPTPNLDKLAEEGTIFTSAYAAHPFCGPSRAGIMTGRYPHEFGAQYNLHDNEYNLGVDLTETFFSKVIQDAGYQTALIGKWHLGQATAHQPNSRGFDYFYGMLTGGHNFFTRTTANGGFGGAYNRRLRKNYGLAGEGTNLYLTDLFTDEGVAFIESTETNDNDPFFLFMSYNAPHSPIQAIESDMTAITSAPYNKTYTNDRRKMYAAMVYAVDRGMKKIVDVLKANGEYENTLIVFTSDNGGREDNIGMANNGPLRGVKGDTYEGGFRVPMFMHWPNVIPADATYPHPVTALDLYPTFVNLAEGTVPNGKELDGKDIIANVIAGTDARPGQPIYTVRHRAVNNVGIRQDKWKAYTWGNGVWQLYDMEADLGETTDVSTQYPEILQAMMGEAYQWVQTHVEPKFFDSQGAEDTWNNNNLPDYDKTFYQYIASVPELIDNSLFGAIYPNPIDSDVSVVFTSQISDEVNVIVYDLNGKPVQIEKNVNVVSSNEARFTISSSIPSGNYIMTVSSGAKAFTKSVLVN